MATLKASSGAVITIDGETGVTIQNLKIPDFPDTQEGRDAKQDFMYRTFEAKGIQPFKNSLPPVYGDSNSTPLEFDITGSTTVKLELVSK